MSNEHDHDGGRDGSGVRAALERVEAKLDQLLEARQEDQFTLEQILAELQNQDGPDDSDQDDPGEPGPPGGGDDGNLPPGSP